MPFISTSIITGFQPPPPNGTFGANIIWIHKIIDMNYTRTNHQCIDVKAERSFFKYSDCNHIIIYAYTTTTNTKCREGVHLLYVPTAGINRVPALKPKVHRYITAWSQLQFMQNFVNQHYTKRKTVSVST